MKYLKPKDLRNRFNFSKLEFKKLLLKSMFFDRRLPKLFRLYVYRLFVLNGRKHTIVRIRNRCILTGRGRGVYSFFGLSRFQFKKLANLGLLTGIERTGW
jgi:small subunit ribosomal protein S14